MVQGVNYNKDENLKLIKITVQVNENKSLLDQLK